MLYICPHDLFYNWMCVPLTPFIYLAHPLHLATTNLFSLWAWFCVCARAHACAGVLRMLGIVLYSW